MRIGIDVRCLMSKNISGVGEYAYNVLDNIFKIDRKNQYQLFYNSQANVTENLPQFHYSNVKYIGYSYPNKVLNTSLKFLKFPKIDKLLKQVDCFFIPNFSFIALSKKCPKTITVHDLSFIRYAHFFSLKRKLWHHFINPLKLLNQCQQIIAVSENTKKDLINLYNLPSKKIKVIYSGIDLNKYKTLDQGDLNLKLIKEKYQLPDNFIFYLGTIEPRKNIETIIESFNQLKKNPQFSDLELAIAGDKGWKYEQVFQFAEKSSFKDHINFIGYVNSQDKVYLYNLAKVFIFPSYYEGFGFPVLEAQACSTPVIASLNSSFPEILADSAILINPDNIQELSQTLTDLLQNKTSQQKHINKGLNNVKKFTWANCAQQTLEYLTGA